MPSFKNAVILLSLLTASNAFQLPLRSGLSIASRTSPLQMSDTELSEVDRLLAAAAKAREEVERLSKVRTVRLTKLMH